MPKTTAEYVGVFLALLTTATILGIVLKLTGVLSWGWGSIIAPLFISLGIVIAIVVVIVLIVTYADVRLNDDEEDCQ